MTDNDQKQDPPKAYKPKVDKTNKLHAVGQLNHNIHKVLRVAEKVSYPQQLST